MHLVHQHGRPKGLVEHKLSWLRLKQVQARSKDRLDVTLAGLLFYSSSVLYFSAFTTQLH